jgi:hypothetical protein
MDGFLKARNIYSTTPFGKEVKLKVPCHTSMACKKTFHSS